MQASCLVQRQFFYDSTLKAIYLYILFPQFWTDFVHLSSQLLHHIWCWLRNINEVAYMKWTTINWRRVTYYCVIQCLYKKVNATEIPGNIDEITTQYWWFNNIALKNDTIRIHPYVRGARFPMQFIYEKMHRSSITTNSNLNSSDQYDWFRQSIRVLTTNVGYGVYFTT